MTGAQSRLLNVGERVRWEESATDLGTVTSNGWGGVMAKLLPRDLMHVLRRPVERRQMMNGLVVDTVEPTLLTHLGGCQEAGKG